MSRLPPGIRPWRTQRDLPLEQVTAWEIDSKGARDESGKALRRLRIKVEGNLAKAEARRRIWLCTLDLEAGPAVEPPAKASPSPRRAPKARLPAAPAPASMAAAKPPASKILLRDYVDTGAFGRWMEKELHPSSVSTRHKQFRSQLYPVLGDWTLEACNTERAQEALRSALDKVRVARRGGKPLSVGYKNQVLNALGSVLTVAADPRLNNGKALLDHRLPVAEYRNDEIAQGQEVIFVDGIAWGRERHKRYSDDEMRRAFAACRDDWEYALAGLGFYCGCRISETCARTFKDINEVDRELHIWNQVLLRTGKLPARLGPTKNRITGYSPLPDQLLEVFRRLQRKATSEFILGPGKELPFLTRVEVSHQWEQLARRAKLSKTNFHACRHSYCSRLADLDFAPQEIQRLARHKKITTTFGYVMPSRERLRRAADVLALDALPEAAE
jgi:integrase